MTDKLFPLTFVILWASAFISSKFIVQDATPFAALCLRFAIVAAGYALFARLVRNRLAVRPQDAAHALLTGALFHGVYLGGTFYAISRGMPAGLAALIVCLQPVLTAAAARPLLGETVTATQWIGIALGFGGVLIVLGIETDGIPSPTAAAAITAALLAITAGTLWQKKFGNHLPLAVGNFYQATSATVFHAAAVLLLETPPAIHLTPQFLAAMSWQILMVSFVSFTLLTYLIKHGSANKTASLFFLVPGVSVLLAWAIADENLPPAALLGLLISSAGVHLATQSKPKTA